MKRLHLVLGVLIALSFCLNGYAAEINKDDFPSSGGTNILYGQKHVFSLVTPPNWVKDQNAQKQSGIPFLIRPNNTDDWNSVYMYALGFDRPENSKENIRTFIESDIHSYRKSHPSIKVKELSLKFDNINNSKLLSGKYYTKEFSEFDDTYKEIIVYIEFPEGVGTIVFSTKSKEVYEKYYLDFINLVNSFQFIANNINIIN